MMSPREALDYMRARPEYQQLLYESYVTTDPAADAERFFASGEFKAVRDLLGQRLPGSVVLDIGAGTGIASFAFARSGAVKVIALEPDGSIELGRAAIDQLTVDLPVEVVEGSGESIPLGDESVDVVYARQVLHHASDLGTMLREVARVLRSGGAFLACREHVVRDPSQLPAFLGRHLVHQLTGQEHAYSREDYEQAIGSSGLTLVRTFHPLDSVINAYPAVESAAELEDYPAQRLRARLGRVGAFAARLPFVVSALRPLLLRRQPPGALHTFLATKGIP